MTGKYGWIEWFFFTQVLCQYCSRAFYNLYNNGAIAIITAWIIFYFMLFSFCSGVPRLFTRIQNRNVRRKLMFCISNRLFVTERPRSPKKNSTAHLLLFSTFPNAEVSCIVLHATQLYCCPILVNRNSSETPVLVRCADIMWAFAGISTVYPGSPVSYYFGLFPTHPTRQSSRWLG
jgi:hypothetical protein